MINKFRGDVSILEPGLQMLEDLVHVPVVGVVPYLMDLKLDDEDSLSERLERHEKAALVDIAVIRLPRISNFTDFNPLEYIDGVSLRYVGSTSELGNPDLIILPGTKNTMADLRWLRQSGLEAAVLKHASHGGPVLESAGGSRCWELPCRIRTAWSMAGKWPAWVCWKWIQNLHSRKPRVQKSGKLPKVAGVFSALSGQPLKDMKSTWAVLPLQAIWYSRGMFTGPISTVFLTGKKSPAP